MLEIKIVPAWQFYSYSAMGALILWIKLEREQQKVHGFSELCENILPKSRRVQYLSEFFVFVIFGEFIGVFAVGHYTQMHAFAGGLSWSRLVAKD